MQRDEGEQLNEPEIEMARSLGRLSPRRPSGFDPRSIAAQAQYRASRQQVWLWRGIAAALAAGLVLSMMLRPAPRTVQQLVYVPAAAPHVHAMEPAHFVATPPERELPPIVEPGDDYWAVRGRVMAFGLSALRPLPSGAGVPVQPTRAFDVPAHGADVDEPPASFDWLDPFHSRGRS